MNKLRGYDSKVHTQDDIDNIIGMYLDSQIEKKKLMRQFSDRLNTIKNIQYYSKKGNEVTKKRFGMDKKQGNIILIHFEVWACEYC